MISFFFIISSGKLYNKNIIAWLTDFIGTSICLELFYHIYQPLRSGRIWHKVNF